MPNYRRAFVPGGMFFFTLVTFDRRRFLTTSPARSMLRDAFAACAERWPFRMNAVVLLPDHLQAIWTLPAGDADFARRWASIERRFTAGWLAEGPGDPAARQLRWARRRSVWQPRFYEHLIRDEPDRDRHFDYLHYNPVKHGYAGCPHAWRWSPFARSVREGIYPPDWSCSCDRPAVSPDMRWAGGLDME